MAHDIRIVTEAALRELVPLDLIAVDVVERGFAALSTGRAIMPPVLSMELPEIEAEVDAKTAVLPGFDSFALKVSTGFFQNAALGLPSLGGLMVVISARTGQVEAVLLDNGYLTDLRTAAAGAVAARHLAPAVEVAGVLGTGLQARAQILAAHLVRPFGRVLVWGRDAAKAKACAAEIGESLGIEARAEVDRARLVAESQLVVTTTASREPLVQADWLHPGLHITAMGSDMEAKIEIEPAALARADLYVADRVSQCAERGELRSAITAGLMPAEDHAELGAIVTGELPGRTAPDQVTIFDSTGTGAQDTAIALHALALAQNAGVGTVIKA
ncbi:MAG: cyclodeaminase [Paracoccaceae bacterium]|nr:cyclodeaminase [Paracoccaceae bacterium]